MYHSLLSGHRILVVEDEYLIAMEVKHWLEEAGAKVVGPVPSVEQALDLVDEDGICAAILDINLGDGEKSFRIADKLDEIGVSYLFATGDVQLPMLEKYRNHPRLEKPISASDLVREVMKLLEIDPGTAAEPF